MYQHFGVLRFRRKHHNALPPPLSPFSLFFLPGVTAIIHALTPHKTNP